jgi:hypothetical protein
VLAVVVVVLVLEVLLLMDGADSAGACVCVGESAADSSTNLGMLCTL